MASKKFDRNALSDIFMSHLGQNNLNSDEGLESLVSNTKPWPNPKHNKF